MINNLLIVVYAFLMHSRWDIAIEVFEMIDMIALECGDGYILFKTLELCFIKVHIEANADHAAGIWHEKVYLWKVPDHLSSLHLQ